MSHAKDCPRYNHNPDNPECTCAVRVRNFTLSIREDVLLQSAINNFTITAAVDLQHAASAVVQERIRQITREGYTPEHDDEHDKGEIARAAAWYALYSVAGPEPLLNLSAQGRGIWPWEGKPSPKNNRDALVKAGALILAEIERIDRAAGK